MQRVLIDIFLPFQNWKPNVLGNATWKPIFKTDNGKLEQFQTVSVLRKVIHKFDVVVDFDFHSIKLSACLMIGLDRHDPMHPGEILHRKNLNETILV